MLTSPKTTCRRAVAGLAATTVVMLVPGAADAAVKGMKTARFHATVSGTQSVEWKQDTTSYDGCIGGYSRKSGSGTERLAFKSTRRGALDVLQVDGDALLNAGLRGLPVRGTISRQGSLHHEQLSGGESECGGIPEGAAPEQPPAPDCGTRKWTGGVSASILSPANYPVTADGIVPLVPVVELGGPEVRGPGSAESLDDLFKNCVGGGIGLTATPNSAFPQRRVFSKAKRLVIRGSDRFTETHDGHTRTVTTRWRMVLVRRGTTVRVPDPAKRRPSSPQCSNGRDDDGDARKDFPRDRECSSPRDRSER